MKFFRKIKSSLKKMQGIVKTVFKIKPRNGQDYISVFSWFISKPMLKLLILLVGIFSVYYLLCINPPIAFGEGIRTYSWDSIPLKFARGKVRIRGKSGYIAYEGEVERGFVSGKGVLYQKSGDVAYTGMFQKNKYEGEGKLYYPGGKIQYDGTFEDNVYSGEGVLYRENGSKEYEGGFVQGKKEGEGKLFDSGNNEIFAGNFRQDELLYSNLLGKSTEDISQIYHGGRKIYTDGEEEFSVALEDIDAVYCGNQDGAALDDSMKVEGIYVLNNEIFIQDSFCKSIPEIRKLLGEPQYEGNSAVTFAEAVAISYLNQRDDCLFGPVNMEYVNEFSDVITVNRFQPDYIIYLYTYTLEQIRYTFFCDKKNGDISMYLIEKES